MDSVLGIVLKRLGLGLLTLLVISVLIFGAVELLPGDIAQAVLGQGATEENLAAMREQMGLNRPPSYAISTGWQAPSSAISARP